MSYPPSGPLSPGAFALGVLALVFILVCFALKCMGV